eukprot:364809-Chlamydomonas_euryale.AAC.19
MLSHGKPIGLPGCCRAADNAHVWQSHQQSPGVRLRTGCVAGRSGAPRPSFRHVPSGSRACCAAASIERRAAGLSLEAVSTRREANARRRCSSSGDGSQQRTGAPPALAARPVDNVPTGAGVPMRAPRTLAAAHG